MLEAFGVAEHFGAGLAIEGEMGEQRFRRLDARFHGHVGALDLGHVEEAGGVADQQAARKAEFGHRLEAAFVERPRAVGNAPAALEDLADLRVGLETLEFLVGRQVRVAVVQPDHEAYCHLVVLEVIQEGAAIDVGGHGPADGVHGQSGLVHFGAHFPQFLDADAVGLRVGTVAQIEFGKQALGQRAAAAFREHRLAGVQLDAGLVVGAGLTVLLDTHVAGGDALDRAVRVEKHFGGGEARVDLDAQRLGLLTQPAHHVAEADDEVALVVHLRRGG